MSFVAHPGWQRYSPHLRVERDKDSPATILKIAFDAPPKVRRAATKLRMACVACGRIVSPVRNLARRHVFEPFCPPSVRRTCAQDPLVTQEYERIGRLVAHEATA